MKKPDAIAFKRFKRLLLIIEKKAKLTSEANQIKNEEIERLDCKDYNEYYITLFHEIHYKK